MPKKHSFHVLAQNVTNLRSLLFATPLCKSQWLCGFYLLPCRSRGKCHKPHGAGLFYCASHFALVKRACAGAAAAGNLRARRHKLAQKARIFEVYGLDIVFTDKAFFGHSDNFYNRKMISMQDSRSGEIFNF